jgi:uncharacterized protein (DUF433 family)
MNHQEVLRSLITINPDILGGEPVFKGTRVPVRTLFEYLQKNYTLEEFLEYFPTVGEDAALKLLGEAEAYTLEQAA